MAGGLAGLATTGSAEYVSLAGLVALLTAGFLLLDLSRTVPLRVSAKSKMSMFSAIRSGRSVAGFVQDSLSRSILRLVTELEAPVPL